MSDTASNDAVSVKKSKTMDSALSEVEVRRQIIEKTFPQHLNPALLPLDKIVTLVQDTLKMYSSSEMENALIVSALY